MGNKVTLSIIIPVFKYVQNGKFLSQLLDRINNQKESQFNIIDVILINDSPEYELESIFEYNKANFDIKIINNTKNQGQAYSRNIGYSISKGDYLHFIDQDDLLDLSFYSNITHINDINITNCYLFNENNVVIHMRKNKQLILKHCKKISSLKSFLIFDNIVLSPGQLIVKRNILNIVSGFPLLKNYGSDDYGFMFNLTKYDIKYSYSSKANFYHRLHVNQGKNILNMTASKNEFIQNYIVNQSIFKHLCLLNFFPINVIKKFLYLLFYNRLT
jgi:glycosyltransferase involved in cell wall biosynthesis